MSIQRPEVIEWNTTSPLVESLEDIIYTSKVIAPPNPQTWHDTARQYAEKINPLNLAVAGIDLLDALPYADIIEAVEDTQYVERLSLQRARMGRKLLLTARDAIILSTDKNQSDDYRLLRESCMLLGRLADANGQDASLVSRTVDALEALSETPSAALEHLHSADKTEAKILRWLSSDVLLHTDETSDIDVNLYHQRRKDFRRIANIYGLIACRSESVSFKRFASEGMILNSNYGKINDALDISTEK